MLLDRRLEVDDNDVVVANAAQALEYLSERSDNHVLRCDTVLKPTAMIIA